MKDKDKKKARKSPSPQHRKTIRRLPPIDSKPLSKEKVKEMPMAMPGKKKVVRVRTVNGSKIYNYDGKDYGPNQYRKAAQDGKVPKLHASNFPDSQKESSKKTAYKIKNK